MAKHVVNNDFYKEKKKEDCQKIIEILAEEYPEANCSLNFREPIELVVALILAAQCTDERVNKTTPILFNKYPDVYALANANPEEIAQIVRPCGFYKTKSVNINEAAKTIVNKFDGKVPDTMEELTTLNGIGRKSANIILQECFDKTVGIAVDTHVTRISRKIGFSNGKDAKEIEKELMAKFPKKYWNKINHILVYHGRAICIARRPLCSICPIQDYCNKND